MTPRRWFVLVATAAVVAACGSRTGLLVPTPSDLDGGPSDALPPIDVVVPVDAGEPCADAGATLVYLVTSENVLMSFYPPAAAFTRIGILDCPTTPGDSPFSMAVDHLGIAYVAYASGNVFRVSTADASCQATARVPPPGVFQSTFGMGFSANPGVADGGESETLYLAGNPGAAVGYAPIVLGSMDTTTFVSTPIAPITPSIYGAELSGTGSGQLFAFYLTSPDGGEAAIGEVDRTTGSLVANSALPGVVIQGGWAFGLWGGDFYTFTAPSGMGTVVQRFRPSDGSITQVAAIPGLTVVGAGVSTCAPQR